MAGEGNEAARVAALLGVSRETQERLEAYAELLRRWQKSINLVGPKTLPELWVRHMLDSGQLLAHLPTREGTLVDLGSGAGFPGLVLAILGAGDVHLIESDQRKAAFLREAARVTGTKVTIHTQRIEAVTGLEADVVTARALAPLQDLVAFASRFLKKTGVALFLKGENVDDELTVAAKEWKMRVERLPSLSSASGIIVQIKGLSRHDPR